MSEATSFISHTYRYKTKKKEEKNSIFFLFSSNHIEIHLSVNALIQFFDSNNDQQIGPDLFIGRASS
jgi:hypothetical protein